MNIRRNQSMKAQLLGASRLVGGCYADGATWLRLQRASVCCTAALAILCACSTTPPPACTVAADCASGVCHPDGTCAPVAADAISPKFLDVAGDGSAAKGTDGGAHPDTASATEVATGDSGGQVLGCQPNHDGIVSRSEVPIAAGLQATWRATTNATVNSAGAPQSDGSKTWDLSGTLAGDHTVTLQTNALAGAWYASNFAGATYATKMAEDSDLIGVFEATPDALLLRGVVSPADGLVRTLLTYTPPVPVLSFPLQAGGHWHTAATVTGQAQGVLVTYWETWDSTVDAHGTLQTPLGLFPVLRVRTELDQLVGLLNTHKRTLLFVSECFGAVAAMDAVAGESAIDFTNAASVRRIAQ